MWVLYGFLDVQWFLLSDFVDLKNHGIAGNGSPGSRRGEMWHGSRSARPSTQLGSRHPIDVHRWWWC